MLSKIAAGDEVATTGGILGKVIEVGEQFLTLEIANGVNVKLQKIPGRAAAAQGHGQERMISYPRWKIVLVAVVLVIGILLALPNVFGEENALQLARDRAVVSRPIARASRSCSKSKGVMPSGAFLEQGRLTLRFASKQDQLKARDVISRGAAQRVHHRAVAGLARARVDAQPGLESAEARSGPARRRLSRVPGRCRGRGEAAARSSRAGLSRLAAQCPGPLSGRAGGLPGGRVRVLFRDADSLAKGKAAILADNRNLNLTETTVDGAPALAIAAHAAGDQGARRTTRSSRTSSSCAIA